MNRITKTILSVLCIVLVLCIAGCAHVQTDPQPEPVDLSGWYTAEDGTVRYLDAQGQAVVGWIELDGNAYYFDPEQDGAMYTGWLDREAGRSYLSADGTPAVGWVEIEGVTYCFDASGVMQTGWVESGFGLAYLDETGALRTGWIDVEGEAFYLDEHGVPCTGWMTLETDTYYFDESGVMQIGWLEETGSRYYFGEEGSLTVGWLDTEEGSYYFDESGVMQTGWQELDATYFFCENGTAYTGWMDNEEGLRYFHPDGRMAIGRVEIDGKVYYFTSSGERFILTNIWNPVPDDYETELTTIDGFRISVECHDALVELIAACEAAGYPCKFTSTYRSYERQVELFEKKVNKLMGQGYSRAAAEAETAKSIAVPGTSEHQLGLAVDLKNGSGTYNWLAKNSWKYGFIMRYPSGKTAITGIYYEPWHYRYVGVELAKELYDLGLCVEEYMEMLTEQASKQTAR